MALFEAQEQFDLAALDLVQEPGKLDELRTVKLAGLIDLGIERVKRSQLAHDLEQSALQGLADMRKRKQGLEIELEGLVQEAMTECLLNPACDDRTHAERRGSLQQRTSFLRDVDAYALRYKLPQLRIAALEADAEMVEAHADRSYVAALISSAERHLACRDLLEHEGAVVMDPRIGKTAELYQTAREAYQLWVAAREAVDSARKRAEALAQGGVL